MAMTPTTERFEFARGAGAKPAAVLHRPGVMAELRSGVDVPWVLVRAILIIALATVVCAVVGCGSGNAVSGEVRFHRDVDLPDGATVTVWLLDTTLIDAPAVELGRDVIENAERLPVRFSIEYDRSETDERNEYSLRASVELDNELLYINDTVHTVLTRDAPLNRDVGVISVHPYDRCVEPLPGLIYSSFWNNEPPDDAILRVRLWDVSEPEGRFVVTETSFGKLGEFPIAYELPYDGVEIGRHRRYEIEADIWFDGELQLHIPANPEWRRAYLLHCPNDDLQIVHDVFPVSEYPAE